MPPQAIVERDRFLEVFKETKGESILPFHKYFTPTVKLPEGGKGDIVFTISNGAVDRDNDTISAAGWNIKNYKKNPVIMWGHDYSLPPIGRSKKLTIKGDDLISVPTFVPKTIYPFAGMVEELILGDWIRATSVGFKGEELIWNEKRGGIDFLKQELLEYSIVPIPSNPEALCEAKGAGVDLSPMVQWAESILLRNKDLSHESDLYEMTWLKHLDQAVKRLNRKRVFIDIDLMETKGVIFDELPEPSKAIESTGSEAKGCEMEHEEEKEPVTPVAGQEEGQAAEIGAASTEPEASKKPELVEPVAGGSDPVLELEPSPEVIFELEPGGNDEKGLEMTPEFLEGLVKAMAGAIETQININVPKSVAQAMNAYMGRLD